jgi:hypothetical protein
MLWLPNHQRTDPILTAYFSGLRRDCETGEWQDIDVSCPGLAEPFRSSAKAIQQREVEEGALLFGPDGSPIVMR